MADAVQPSGTLKPRRDDLLSIIALVALACIVGHVVSPSLLGFEMPYAGGAAVIVGIGAVICAWLNSRPARLATACAVLGLVLLRVASSALPAVLARPHGAPSLLDCVGMLILSAAAVMMLFAATIRR